MLNALLKALLSEDDDEARWLIDNARRSRKKWSKKELQEREMQTAADRLKVIEEQKEKLLVGRSMSSSCQRSREENVAKVTKIQNEKRKNYLQVRIRKDAELRKKAIERQIALESKRRAVPTAKFDAARDRFEERKSIRRVLRKRMAVAGTEAEAINRTSPIAATQGRGGMSDRALGTAL